MEDDTKDSNEPADETIENEEHQPQEVSQENEEEKNKKKSTRISFAILILLLLLGGLAYAFYGDDNDDSTDTSQTDQTSQQDTTENTDTNNGALDMIVYAHADDENTPRSLFERSVNGGDRTDLEGMLDSDIYMISRDDGAYVVADSSDNTIWYGEGNTAPSNIHEITGSVFITGLVLDEANETIAISYAEDLSQPSPNTKIIKIGTDGADQGELISNSIASAQGAHFIEGWDSANGQMLYRNSCVQCDGYNATLLWTDGTDNRTIYDADSSYNVFGYSVDSGFENILFVRGTEYTQQQIEEYEVQIGLGVGGGPPYELVQISIETGQEQVLATYGEIEDIRGLFTVVTNSGWSDSEDQQRPYYTYQNNVFAMNGTGTFDKVFETGQGDITNVYTVTNNEVLVGSRNDDGEVISHFNIETQEATTVMETTFSTLILTITKQ